MWRVMEFRTIFATNAKVRAAAGLTLVESLVTIAIWGLILMITVPLTVYSGRSFAGMANYADLNTSGMYALDQMTKDVRQAVALTGFATNQLTFDAGAGQSAIVFSYDPAKRTLTRQQGTD